MASKPHCEICLRPTFRKVVTLGNRAIGRLCMDCVRLARAADDESAGGVAQAIRGEVSRAFATMCAGAA